MTTELPEKPESREESYLADIAGQEVVLPEKPLSRKEQYLAYIAENGGGGGGGTTNFNQLTNRPKYNGAAMTGDTNIPQVKTYTAGTGLNLTGTAFSVDTDTIQEKLTAGTGIDITDNTISATGGGGGTTYTAGDGITIENNTISADLAQTGGSSTTKIMSQKAVTDFISGAKSIKLITDLPFNYPENNPDGYIISDLFSWEDIYYAAENSVKLYYSENDYINFSGYLQAGLCDYSFDDYEIYTYGFTITKLNGTSNTPEIYVGQTQYIPEHWDETLEDDVPASWTSLSFEQVGAGGGGGDTVYSTKTTSNSNTGGAVYIGNLGSDQAEVADPSPNDNHYKYFWALPSSNNGATYGFPGDGTVNIMGSARGAGSVTIGRNAGSGSYGAITMVAIGDSANSGNDGVAIGNGAGTSQDFTGNVCIGAGARISDFGVTNSISLGRYSKATRAGELNIGTSLSHPDAGFNSSAYRVIGGVYDGQDLHDAATVAQGNTLSTSAPTTSTEGVLGQLWTDTTNIHTYQLSSIDTTDPSNPVYNWTQRW